MNKSDSIGKIATALSAFQGEMKNPAKTADNPFFKSKYCALDSIVDAIRPGMAKHGLSYIQSCPAVGQDVSVTTLLMHTSGEWIESDPFTLHATKLDPQGAGSAVTYGRRYTLSSVLGIVSEEDTDGNRPGRKGAESSMQDDIEKLLGKKQQDDKPKKDAPINWGGFWKSCTALGYTEAQVHEVAGVDSVKGFSREQLSELMAKLKATKSA